MLSSMELCSIYRIRTDEAEVVVVAERMAHWKTLPLRYRVVVEVVARDRSSLLVLEVAMVVHSIQ